MITESKTGHHRLLEESSCSAIEPLPAKPEGMWSTLEVFADRQLTISTLGLVVKQHHVPKSIDEPAWEVTRPE